MRLIDADVVTSILEEWEEKSCDGTENDGSDGSTRVLHPVPTTTSEMLDLIAEQPTIVAEPVKHGRWIFTNKHLWYKDDDGEVDMFRLDVGFHNGPECQVCHAALCKNCTPNWEETECEKGHYYCSECSETSKDAHENYCPNCGAKMDGERSKA